MQSICVEKNVVVPFPVEGFINPWGFIHLSQRVVEAFGVKEGQKTAVTIDLQEGNNHKEGLNGVTVQKQMGD